MSHAMKWRFSFMMFLEYFVPGATVPILSHYLKNYLHFEAYQTGWILAVPAAAAFVAPFLTTHVADRFISSEKLLALCHLAAGLVMLVLVRQTTFGRFFGVYFVYGLMFTPTFGLTNTVALHHLTDAKRDFGGIRMWGTAGWVVVAWTFGYLWMRAGGDSSSRLPHMLYVSAFSSFALAAYALTLPPSPAHFGKPASVMYWKALRLFARPSLAILCVMTFFSAAFHQVYYFGMSPFLSDSGFANHNIMPTMAVGQLSEVIVLGILGWCLSRLSFKRAMVLGLLAQTFRYSLFAWGHPAALIVLGISSHGICYAFFFTTAYLYVDQHSTPQTRAGAQQILTIMIAGFGTLAGLAGGGYLAQWLTEPATGQINFTLFWVVPAVLSAVAALAIEAFFHEEPARPTA